MKIFKNRRATVEVNASSMADIAFLLLIFFLVTTVIDIEKGILVQLPPFDNVPPPPVNSRNVFTVKINAYDQLLVEGGQASPENLRQLAKSFIMNPEHSLDLAAAPNQAVISLQNDRSTSYKTYISVYNELKAAYHELWEEAALRRFAKSYGTLSSEAAQKIIRDEIPMVISESEPVDFAQQ
jgi:biopolymer transport protein ExbD